MTSPSASEPQTFRLQVLTDNAGAEVFLLDDEVRLVDRTLGDLERHLPAGVYRVKVTLGRRTEERSVLLDGDRTIDLRALAFASPAPLDGTSRTREDHIAAAERESARVHASRGEGAQIFVLARYWTADGSTPSTPLPHPATGLSLARADGSQTVDLEKEAVCGTSGDPWAACTVSVDPGGWILRRVTSDGDTVLQSIVASPGWQTQVFLLHRPRPDDDEPRRPDRFSMSVLMSRGPFDQKRSDMRLAEVARLALADERRVLSLELRDMLRGKFENPMLGMLGAHLMLLAREQDAATARRRPDDPPKDSNPIFDQGVFDEVVIHLRALVGLDHPDVKALALQCGAPELRPQAAFTVPPMLRRSWSLLVAASNTNPDLVPASMWDTVRSMTAGRPYLFWLQESADDQAFCDATLKKRLGLGVVNTVPGMTAVDTVAQVALQALAESEDFRRQLSLDLDIPRSVLDRVLPRRLG